MTNILKSSIPYKGPISENLIEFIHLGLQKHSEQTILIDSGSGRTWTGKEIQGTISCISRYLIDQCDLRKGDVCEIYGKSDDHAALLILSVISAGGVSIFNSDSYRLREVVDTAKTTNTKYLISTKNLLEKIKSSPEILDALNDGIRIISYDKICEGFKNGCTLIGHLLDKESQSLLPTYTCAELAQKSNIDNMNDFAVIQFSSGTTGKPKPIPRTHSNLCHLVGSVDHEELMDLRPGEVMMGSLTMTHRPGLWALLACINGGSAFVLWGNLSDIQDTLKTVEKYNVTILSASLPFLAMLGNIGVQIKDQYKLSSLKHIITSGSKIVSSDLPTLMVKEFNLRSLRQCFGMTESGWVFLIERSLAQDNYLSVGHVCPSTEAVILDRETGKPVGMETRGELALRGPQIFPGYLTSEKGVFNRGDFTEDGWFRTGDQAFYDSRQLIFIEGRFKELMIFKNGGRFFPNEIETVISEHPSIEGACVIKVGEFREAFTYDIARAYVTLKQGCNLTEKELIDFVTGRSYEITLEGGVRFLDKFPRLANGKVDKTALKNIA